MLASLPLLLGGTQARRMLSMHALGYVLRQKIYDEVLSGTQLLKESQELFSPTHHVDIWFLGILPCVLAYAVRDLERRKVFLRLRENGLTSSMVKMMEGILLVLLIVFTKDVENAI